MIWGLLPGLPTGFWPPGTPGKGWGTGSGINPGNNATGKKGPGEEQKNNWVKPPVFLLGEGFVSHLVGGGPLGGGPGGGPRYLLGGGGGDLLFGQGVSLHTPPQKTRASGTGKKRGRFSGAFSHLERRWKPGPATLGLGGGGPLAAPTGDSRILFFRGPGPHEKKKKKRGRSPKNTHPGVWELFWSRGGRGFLNRPQFSENI